jgi:hypothetical protein
LNENLHFARGSGVYAFSTPEERKVSRNAAAQ